MNFPKSEMTGTRPVTLIQALSPTSPLGDVKEEILHRLNQISLGQQLEADVQTRLSDGSFLVKLADTITKMNLPDGTNVGDKLNLTLIDKTPRPTFLLNAAADLPARINSTPTEISNTAKLITTLLQASSNQTQPAVVGNNTPIISSTMPATPEIAASLKQAITQSGVFYESHLAAWVSGQMSLPAIKQEPQAQLVNQMNALVTNTDPANTAITKQADVTNNPVLNNLLNAQLHTLENNHIMWQGQAWQGQAMQWAISQDTPQQQSNQEDRHQIWRSDVKFELPGLGTITATLRLNGEHLSVQIRTDNDSTTNTLQTNSQSFQDALAAVGIPLDALLVKHHE
ncbi:MAG: flagellar hook-length control protein FliK [Sulfuriferula sp.]